MIESIILFATYFGKLPEYILTWLHSCSRNKNIQFVLITDQEINYEIPANVRIINHTLESIKDVFQKKLNIEVQSLSPYKICDFRPAFGIIFEEFVKGFAYWGYTDIDVVYGDLSKFLNEDKYYNYDKVYQYGHLTLIRNSNHMNNMFKSKEAIFDYRNVFSSNEYYAFDEKKGINYIVKKMNVVEKENINLGNCSRKYRAMIINSTPNIKNERNQIFVWEDGKLYQYFQNKNIISKKELMYIHFQWKNPKILNWNPHEKWLIKENAISSFSHWDKEIFKEGANRNRLSDLYYNTRFILLTISRFINMSSKQRKIWIKQHF